MVSSRLFSALRAAVASTYTLRAWDLVRIDHICHYSPQKKISAPFSQLIMMMYAGVVRGVKAGEHGITFCVITVREEINYKK